MCVCVCVCEREREREQILSYPSYKMFSQYSVPICNQHYNPMPCLLPALAVSSAGPDGAAAVFCSALAVFSAGPDGAAAVLCSALAVFSAGPGGTVAVV